MIVILSEVMKTIQLNTTRSSPFLSLKTVTRSHAPLTCVERDVIGFLIASMN